MLLFRKKRKVRRRWCSHQIISYKTYSSVWVASEFENEINWSIQICINEFAAMCAIVGFYSKNRWTIYKYKHFDNCWNCQFDDKLHYLGTFHNFWFHNRKTNRLNCLYDWIFNRPLATTSGTIELSATISSAYSSNKYFVPRRSFWVSWWFRISRTVVATANEN